MAPWKKVAQNIGMGLVHAVNEFAEHLPHHVDASAPVLAGLMAFDHR
jgi:hypothetical protein